MTLNTTLPINRDFAELANDEQIDRTVVALEENGFTAVVADDGDDAKRRVFEIIPEGSSVFTATSKTLDTILFNEDLAASGRYETVRELLDKMDPETDEREMVSLGATPEWIVGSVHAVTEDGKALIASATGSQLGPYSAGAQNVVWVVGAQKLVKDFDEGYRRIEEYALPLEDARARDVYGFGSKIGKLLTVNSESPGRVTVVIVKENLGF